MSLSFEDNGTPPIARVIDPSGSELDVYINRKDEGGRIFDFMDEAKSPAEVEEICEALDNKMTLRDIIKTYRDAKIDKGESEIGPEYEALPGEQIEILLDPERDSFYIAGPNGCGKTFLTAQLAWQYHEMYPENEIHLWIRKKCDDSFGDLPRIEHFINETSDPEEFDSIKIEDLANMLCIFDDMDALPNNGKDSLLKAATRLVNEILTVGREQHTYCIYISHMVKDYQRTRQMLNESNKIVLYPGTADYQASSFLKTHASMSPQQIADTLAIDSRWIVFSKCCPKYMIYENGIKVL